MNPTERIVLLVDMDCFYCQVEEKLQPELAGKPIAVVQYNEWKGGGIIAVNYIAKDQGVTRFMRGDEAKQKCPDIELVKVPVVRGKADLTKYRNAGKEVANVLLKYTLVLERASVDEAYLDITENVSSLMCTTQVNPSALKNTHVVESSVQDFLNDIQHDLTNDNLRLALGGMIAEEIRTAVYNETGYRCSAGIAHNKILAKLACGLHKPNQQTILPQNAVESFFNKLPVRKIRSLGGKFGGAVVEDLGIKNVGELAKFSEKELIQRYDEKTGSWLYNIARGINYEPVTTRLIAKSIGCCKNFSGKSALLTEEDVKRWIYELATELLERLENDMEENNRKAKNVTVGFQYKNNKKTFHGTRVQPLNAYDVEKIAKDAYEVLKKNCMKPDGTYHITFMGLTSSKFDQLKNTTMDIKSFFKVENSNEKKKESNSPQINNNLQTFQQPEELKLRNDIEKDDFSSDKNDCNDSDDSISNELVETSNASPKNQKESFFDNYFNAVHGKRSFDTSRHLEESGTNFSDEISANKDFQSEINENFEEDSETCEECGQNIKKSEQAIHSDYHLALSLTEQEKAHNRGTSSGKSMIEKKIKTNTTKSTKRKSPETSKTASISKYFKKNVVTNSNDLEKCRECDKLIEPSEMQSHLDYHVAKKLFAEINGNSLSGNLNGKKISKESDNKSNKKEKIQSVISFFKQPA